MSDSVNTILCLDAAGSTNAWAKQHLDRFGPVGAVYTTNQTAGRGRLGRSWAGAAGQALYYTAVLKTPLAQPATLPLFASLAVADALRRRYGVDCRIKWPNDLLLNGKKIVGILCEGIPAEHAIICGIGINLAQPQSYFDAAALPHATSLAVQGVGVDLARDPGLLAQDLTDFGFDRGLYRYESEGFAACRAAYNAACVNLGRRVFYDCDGGSGSGLATDVDEEGRLVVQDDGGTRRIFTGEVSVRGIYGALGPN